MILPPFRSSSAISRMRHRRAAGESFGVLSHSVGISARRFPLVNVGLIVANCAIWSFHGRVDVGGDAVSALRAAA
jgi:hypothetical protein